MIQNDNGTFGNQCVRHDFRCRRVDNRIRRGIHRSVPSASRITALYALWKPVEPTAAMESPPQHPAAPMRLYCGQESICATPEARGESRAVRLLCSSVSSRSGTAPPQHLRISAFPCKLSRRPPRNQVKGSGNPWTPREKRRGSQASLIHDASEPCLYLVGRLHPSS